MVIDLGFNFYSSLTERASDDLDRRLFGSC